MKKLTTLLLSIVLLCGAMVGCRQKPTEEKDQTETDQDAILTDYDYTDSQHGFSIKGQKFNRGNNNVLILEVENTTDTHYTATFSVTFYDDAGEEVGKRTKTLEQFPAKYKQAVVFEPYSQFDNYTCELSVEEYTGTDYLSTLSCGKYNREISVEIHPDRTVVYIYAITKASFGPYTNFSEGKKLGLEFDVVVFDNTGKIWKIDRTSFYVENTDTVIENYKSVPLIISTDVANLQVPEELEGELTVILAPTDFYIKDFT